MENEIMLIVAKELACKYGYILTDESTIIGKKDRFWGNKELFPEVQIKTCTYILPAWEDEQEKADYCCRKIYLDMFWGLPRLHVRYPDKDFCCILYKAGKFYDAQAFGEKGLEQALMIKNRINELIELENRHRKLKKQKIHVLKSISNVVTYWWNLVTRKFIA